MITASPASGSTHATIALKRYFLVGMAALILLTVFAGFAPSFYLRSAFRPDHELSIVLHLHGLAFSAWVILFLVQTILIAKGSPRLHRRLGWITLGVALAMLLLVGAATVEQMRRGIPLEDAAQDIAFNLFGSVMFAVPLSGAILWRKRPDWHKRLMLCATLALLGAPILRLILLSTHLEFPTAVNWSIVLWDMFFLPGLAFDLLTRGRIHRAYAYGIGLIVASQIVMLHVVAWPSWLDFSRTVQHLVG
jgi:hypothetical protein